MLSSSSAISKYLYTYLFYMLHHLFIYLVIINAVWLFHKDVQFNIKINTNREITKKSKYIKTNMSNYN